MWSSCSTAPPAWPRPARTRRRTRPPRNGPAPSSAASRPATACRRCCPRSRSWPGSGSRTVGSRIAFRTSLLLYGQDSYKPPRRLWLEVDGKPVRDVEVPPAQAAVAGLETKPQHGGQVALAPIEHAFDKAGSHVLSVVV